MFDTDFSYFNFKQPSDCAYDSLKEEIRTKDEVICNICSKYLKMKRIKQSLQKKLEVLELQTQKVCYTNLKLYYRYTSVFTVYITNNVHSMQICENIVCLLQENKTSIDSLLNRLITTSGTATDSCKKYFKVLKVNSNLHYENTQLKVELSQKKLLNLLNGGCEPEPGCNHTESSSRNKHLKLNEKITTNNFKKKILAVTNQPPYSKIRRRIALKTNFKSVHEMFSPHFRRRIIRYNSDPCLTRIVFR